MQPFILRGHRCNTFLQATESEIQFVPAFTNHDQDGSDANTVQLIFSCNSIAISDEYAENLWYFFTAGCLKL